MSHPLDLSPYVIEAARRMRAAYDHHKAVEAGKEPRPDIDWDNIEAARNQEVQQ